MSIWARRTGFPFLLGAQDALRRMMSFCRERRYSRFARHEAWRWRAEARLCIRAWYEMQEERREYHEALEAGAVTLWQAIEALQRHRENENWSHTLA